MYHSNPALTKALLSIAAAVLAACSVQWPEYGPLLNTLAGALGGTAFATAPGHLSPSAAQKMARASVPPRA